MTFKRVRVSIATMGMFMKAIGRMDRSRSYRSQRCSESKFATNAPGSNRASRWESTRTSSESASLAPSLFSLSGSSPTTVLDRFVEIERKLEINYNLRDARYDGLVRSTYFGRRTRASFSGFPKGTMSPPFLMSMVSRAWLGCSVQVFARLYTFTRGSASRLAVGSRCSGCLEAQLEQHSNDPSSKAPLLTVLYFSR